MLYFLQAHPQNPKPYKLQSFKLGAVCQGTMARVVGEPKRSKALVLRV